MTVDDKIDQAMLIEQLYKWLKEGQASRDTPGKTSPYSTGTIQHYMCMTGWLQRDLQLALARYNPGYRQFLLGAGLITEEGIRGGYTFEEHTHFVEAIVE